MTRFTVLLSLLAAGLAVPMVGGVGPVAAPIARRWLCWWHAGSIRGQVRVERCRNQGVRRHANGSGESSRDGGEPTLNHQRPLNDDLARFTRVLRSVDGRGVGRRHAAKCRI